VGWKGSALTVTFLFYNLLTNLPTSHAAVMFSRHRQPARPKHGIAFHTLGHQPDEHAESIAAASADFNDAVHGCFRPNVAQSAGSGLGREQRAVLAVLQLRLFARHDRRRGKHDRGVPYTSCAYTRTDCEARGMFNARCDLAA